jgi:hypothetical protein
VTTDLPPGKYSGSVNITAMGVSNSPLTVPVSLIISSMATPTPTSTVTPSATPTGAQTPLATSTASPTATATPKPSSKLTLLPRLALFAGWPHRPGSSATFRLVNGGTVNVNLVSVRSLPAGMFTVARTNCAPVLAPGAQCSVTVRFDPMRPGVEIGTLTVTDDAANGSQKSALMGFSF